MGGGRLVSHSFFVLMTPLVRKPFLGPNSPERSAGPPCPKGGLWLGKAEPRRPLIC